MSSEKRKKVLFIFGKMGSGKSNTANKLLQKDVFDVGNGQEAMTTEMNRGENDDFIIFDFPGTGEHEDRYLLEFHNHRKILIDSAPINAFIFLSKLDKNNPVPSLDVAKDFFRFFGVTGLDTLMFLCIQEGIRLGQDNFRGYLHQTEAYKFLNDELRNNNQVFNREHVDIQHCLWDNRDKYFGQDDNFRNCLNTLQEFKSENLRNPVQNIDDEVREIIEKKKKRRQEKDEKNREKMAQLKSYSNKILIVGCIATVFYLIYRKINN